MTRKTKSRLNRFCISSFILVEQGEFPILGFILTYATLEFCVGQVVLKK